MFVCAYVCVFMCVCEKERRKKEKEKIEKGNMDTKKQKLLQNILIEIQHHEIFKLINIQILFINFSFANILLFNHNLS